ncbi:protein kinase [Chrysosporum ovalisporum CS-1034]|uniref:protein kinase domain-containing protein n=1 Tax=Umezakia ovalisporum TaxID=75695 RepID=UPI0024772C03|nr:protein kinase [Umezakia ovalisporum]MDH6074260.1 protein kinase [Umezakia ovalisporum CS-1034]
MTGQLLQARYQILHSLGKEVFGQTYMAVDNYALDPENAKCVIKNLKGKSFPPSYLDTLRLCFAKETTPYVLQLLGSHSQIPKLISCFEENEQFYLVQEFVEGHSLSAELPINQDCRCNWTEKEVVEFLAEILGILEFIHAQGIIHCGIKPENLIRRTIDDKLVLIDFSSIQSVNLGLDGELPIYEIPLTSLGYIPPEQFIGQTQPNSDIYALGMIAIQALTGLEPLQLKVDPKTREILWHTPDISVNEDLAVVLSHMIRYDYQYRFHSAGEILHILKQLFGETKIKPSPEKIHQLYEKTTIESDNTQQQSHLRQLSPLLTRIKVGLAANSLLMGFGIYSVIRNSPTYSETETLHKAREEYQTGDLQKALALAQSIPPYSNVYPEAQATMEEWEQQWQFATKKYEIAEQALKQGKWSDVLAVAPQVPNILYWQSKVDKLVQQAKFAIERQTYILLSQAYGKATAKDFSTAIEYLGQIPQESSSAGLVQEKLVEYNQKRQIRAAYFLHSANVKAHQGDFNAAVDFLRKIPKNTSVYPQAQIKLHEYTQKQQLQIQSKNVVFHFSTTKNDKFQPENHLQEVNIP